jgi:predicted enzyme related to lactoylglutathione lyase
MNAITWFEIPTTDFERAVSFYETIFAVSLHRQTFNDEPNAIFPYTQESGVGGAVVHSPYSQPGTSGPVVYINAQSDTNLGQILGRVESAGGKIVMPKTDIGPVGVIAMVIDPEGNRVGLHAQHPQAS